jgi:hypothetical protein
MKKMILTATAALSVLAFPVAFADARPGHGGGNGNGHGHGDRHGAPEQVASDDQQTATDTPAEQPAESRRHASRKCKRAHSVGFVAKGSLKSYTEDSVTLDVTRANRHARSFLAGAEPTFTLGTARVRFSGVTDADGNGAVDFADVLPTDKVVATGKATRPKRGCEGETVLKLRKLQVVRPVADESDDSEDEQQS